MAVSLRRVRFGLPPRPTPLPSAGPENARAANTKAPPEPKSQRAPRVKPTPITADKGSPSLVGALQRIEPRPGGGTDGESDMDARMRLEADTCTCRVRGTVELEFERLLTRPMRIEVGIRELPAMRDTIEMFMGSPRSFEFPRVPCGRWSLSLRPFSERPFGVTTPEQIAPFDCGQRSLRQVRIVIAPL